MPFPSFINAENMLKKGSHTHRSRFVNMVTCAKICFLTSLLFIFICHHFFYTRPAMILYLLTSVFILSMIIRVVEYWRTKLILFMLDLCYCINLISLIFVWCFPHCYRLQAIQFGLANSHAYAGAFAYRNSLVFHDFQKLTSSLIHILPCIFSYLIRWYPRESSVWWYTDFIDSGTSRDPAVWHQDLQLLWHCLVPVLIYVTRDILYFITVYGCIKPSAEYMDSFRYMKTRKVLETVLWKRFHSRWHMLIYMTLGLLLVTSLLALSIASWSNYAFHTFMVLLLFPVVFWNAACYYVDCYRPPWNELESSKVEAAKTSSSKVPNGHHDHHRMLADSSNLGQPTLVTLEAFEADVQVCPGGVERENGLPTFLCVPSNAVLQVVSDGSGDPSQSKI